MMRTLFAALLGLIVAALGVHCAEPTKANISAPKYTFVIVHGAWAGGWEHKKLGEALEADGHKVYRVTLTGQGERSHLARPDIGVSLHIQDVVNAIEWEDLRDVVLVGHSYGGMVITGVVDRIPQRFKHVIYLDAAVPENGETATQAIAGTNAPRWKAVDGFYTMGPDMNSKPVPHIVPMPERTFTEPIVLTNQEVARKVPTTYILTVDPGKKPEEDTFFRAYERAKARGWKTEIMEGDHVVHLNKTKETGERLERAAGE